MQIDTLPLGLKAITMRPHTDARGVVCEWWRQDRITAGLGIDTLVQQNISVSHPKVIRGLHLQRQYPQGKLISVLRGEIYDVAVDLRPYSPSYGRYHAEILSDKTLRHLWIPPGFAHGFAVISDVDAVVQYSMDNYYHPEDQVCIKWNDPTLGVAWPVDNPIISSQDIEGISLEEFESSQS